ncbi:MAG: transcription elongation factor GreA [Candidatus Falkowbacteria bacterium]|nr:transcription elongation factor GreA [Candidatus Falkowbacteria bacterium]
MGEQQIISEEGFQKLQEELHQLCTTKRREIADRIEKAKELGDLSENAEYSDAKEAQAFNEGRVSEITSLLKNITVVKTHGKNEIGMGSKITVEAHGKEKEFTIVSFNEADPLSGKVSNESPMGLAFLNKKTGDMVTVHTPKGDIKYKITHIS